MKILVTVKRIPDPVEPPKFAGGQIDTTAAKFVQNEFDEYGIETALRLAEVGGGTERLAEVVVVSVCPPGKREHVTNFLAMGANRAIVVEADDAQLDAQSVAQLVAAVFRRESADLLISGKLSQDNEGNEVAQRIAGLLDLPQATFAASVTWDREGNALQVAREVEDGVETKRVPLPAVLSVDLRIVLPTSVRNGATPADHPYPDKPRLASLRGITMAKTKKVEVLKPADLGVTPGQAVQSKGAVAPPKRQAGKIVGSVEELVEKLATEAKVL
ncbi:MAG: electron transfer flavoprotein subunit beta/FixA family protein [Deltaproteobacteria bacterium]|nr:electron transfer flavoprotein subunit beta/FixA family protein [Deltaproteobacteria bacterium]MBK8238349.1 electron transfer flavoprotein subunit beta/FixA family protein [Deltaproteobacteria bacterium]MBK8720215.1 electron transfer flavoprotein subunit beta/FixA family protein [Deltaproteobacteria bacterium]MBP7286060.1 electron transfer flavoprotein subunit beta/FixA family protein [Nannocystaceae bacterium]